jgi:hypothetical protein
MLPQACHFLLTSPCRLSAKAAYPAQMAKQEQAIVKIEYIILLQNLSIYPVLFNQITITH